MAAIAEVGANDAKKPENEQGKVTIYFGIFFDGTNNHRLQVLIGKKYRSKSALRKFKKWVNKHNISPKNVYAARSIAKDAGLSDKEIEDLFPEANSTDFSTDEALIEEYQKRIDEIDVTAGDANVFLRKELQNKLDKLKAFNDVKDTDFFGRDGETGELKWDETIPSEYGQWNENVEWNSKIRDYDQSSMFGLGSPPEMQTNDYSNIALLEPLYQAKDKLDANEYAYRIYVTGCGTSRDITEGDSTLGKVTGKWSSTDVTQKVTDAVNAVKTKLVHFSTAKKTAIKYHIFGFSRGAAEARILANILSKDTITEELAQRITKCKIKKKNNVKLIHNQKSVQIPFVGLFDTVPSIGVSYDDNIKDYGLNVLASTDDVTNIFHICALDEYRSKFSLTPVPDSDKLLEIYLPGTHSDIGGGYAVGYSKSGFAMRRDSIIHNGEIVFLQEFPTKEEGVENDFYEVNLDNLRKLGWYKEITKKEKDDNSILSDKIIEETNSSIVLNRYSKKGYNYITLRLMHKYACEKITGIFQSTKKFEPPRDLQSVKEIIFNTYKNKENNKIWIGKEKYKWLRQNYLHFSSQEDGLIDSLAFGPNIEINKVKNRHEYKRKRYE